jgi:1-phosphofructokinase
MAAEPTRLPAGRCSVVVFAPAPALSITIESGSPDPEIHLHAAAQGFWVARMAARLGADVTLCAPLGGETGAVLESLLAVDSIELLSVAMAGSNGAYIHDRRGGTRHKLAVTPSPELHRHELDDLYGVTLAAGMAGDAVLLTGPGPGNVLPAAVYERLCRDLKGNGRRVLADLSGEELSAALSGGIDLLKVSDEELLEAGRLERRDRNAAADAARRLHDEGAENVVISRAARPAVVLADGRLLEADGPHFVPVDEHGAGDSMFAGMGVGIGSGLPVESAVRIGVAAGILNVARRGLGTGHLREVSTLAQQVRVTPIDEDQGDEAAASTAS